MLPARARLRDSTDFAAVLRGSRAGRRSRQGSRLIVLYAAATDANPAGAARPPRVGFVVSKAVGGAVVRNRVKRVLRSVMAARLEQLPEGTDVVIRANPAAAGASFFRLGVEVDRLLPGAVRRLAAGPR